MYFIQSCAAEKSVACPADFLDIADILVDVSVHGHRNLGMPGDALQGFDVYATCGLQLGQEGVAKQMRGHTLGNRQTFRFLFAHGQMNALGRILRQQIAVLHSTIWREERTFTVNQ